MLAEARRPLRRTILVKRLFLLRHETVLSEDSTFYDFVPYKFGPFSFALYREVEALEQHGYIASEGERLVLAEACATRIRDLVEGLTTPVRSAVSRVTAQYGRMAQDELLQDVYARYPWYASRTERVDLLTGPALKPEKASPAAYTLGYEGRSVDGFFARVLCHGLEVVADVRANPLSRKYGFAGSSLRRIGEKLGVRYEHFPTLGIPSSARACLSDRASYEDLFRRYEREILPQRAHAVGQLGMLMQTTPSVLVCMECEPEYCHRSRLASAISRATNLSIQHL